MYNFGKILKELRKNRHLTQEQLAKFLQTSRTNIACYEQNVNTPPTDMIRSMAAFFGVTTDYLLGFDTKCRLLVDDLSEDQILNIKFIIEQYRKLNELNNEE